MTPVHVLVKPPVEVPLPRLEPEVDPQRELRELTEAIRDDSRDAPDEYLEEVRVACGGE